MATKIAFRPLAVAAMAIITVSCGSGPSDNADPKSPARSSTTPQSVELPYSDVAQRAACPADAQVIRAAEDAYALLHGVFATMSELVGSQYVRDTSRYYREVKIGVPPGGYTLIAVPTGPCATLPVAGSRP